MSNDSRRHRGLRTQKVIAEYLAANGFPWAQSTGAGRSGSDITGVPGLCIEIKARANFDPMAWVRQAQMTPGLPLVAFRPNGLGETTVASWPCIVRLADLVDLLRAAGYGDPGDAPIAHTPGSAVSATESRPGHPAHPDPAAAHQHHDGVPDGFGEGLGHPQVIAHDFPGKRTRP